MELSFSFFFCFGIEESIPKEKLLNNPGHILIRLELNQVRNDNHHLEVNATSEFLDSQLADLVDFLSQIFWRAAVEQVVHFRVAVQQPVLELTDLLVVFQHLLQVSFQLQGETRRLLLA
jgi:hypothetical protein